MGRELAGGMLPWADANQLSHGLSQTHNTLYKHSPLPRYLSLHDFVPAEEGESGNWVLGLCWG